jgi:hypothetical protein
MDEMYPKLTYAFKLDPESYQITKDAVDILTDRGRIKGKFDYNAWFDTDLIKTVKPSAQTLPNM